MGMYQKRKERQENKKNETYEVKKTNINWFPGHMAKTKRKIKENLDLIDVVYEIIDARIPYSSKIKDIDELIKNKKRILIFTKKDLCDISETQKWLSFYTQKGYKCILMDLTNNKDYKDLINLTKSITQDLQEKRFNKGLKEGNVKVLVVGVPNVGKSTLINALVGKSIAQTGNKPGVTKSINWLKTKSNILLLDTPGILWPKIDDYQVGLNLASTAAIKSEIIPMGEISTNILTTLKKYYPNVLKDKYNINSDLSILEMFDVIGYNMGAVKNDEIDYNRVNNRIYNDIISGNVKGVTFDRWKKF